MSLAELDRALGAPHRNAGAQIYCYALRSVNLKLVELATLLHNRGSEELQGLLSVECCTQCNLLNVHNHLVTTLFFVITSEYALARKFANAFSPINSIDKNLVYDCDASSQRTEESRFGGALHQAEVSPPACYRESLQ